MSYWQLVCLLVFPQKWCWALFYIFALTGQCVNSLTTFLSWHLSPLLKIKLSQLTLIAWFQGSRCQKQLLWPLKDLSLHPVPPSTHPWAWCLQVAPKRLHHKEKFNKLFAGPFYSSSSWEKGNEILTNTSPHGDQIHSLLSSLPGSQLHSLHCSFIPHYPVLEFSFLKKTNKGILPSSHGNFLLSFLEYFLCTKQKCVTTL